MNEQEIFNRWNSEKPQYLAWANFIGEKIEEQLLPLIAPTTLNYFLKVPMVPRLKADASLIDKALYRNKSYQNPYEDITDKVGVRYVVLLTTHISQLSAIIESSECGALWNWSKDKDYEEERLAIPLEFSYQSVHYVLRAKSGVTFDGVVIPAGIACEVQIRTLLQHAHSELTHDTIYKPKTGAKPSVKRTVAKSMALIEATDEFFEQAMKDLTLEGRAQHSLLAYLATAYFSGTGFVSGMERSNQILVDDFFSVLPSEVESKIGQFFTLKPYIFERIKQQRSARHFFKQPIVLLAYYLADKMPAQTKEKWPFTTDDLSKIFSDLGRSFDD